MNNFQPGRYPRALPVLLLSVFLWLSCLQFAGAQSRLPGQSKPVQYPQIILMSDKFRWARVEGWEFSDLATHSETRGYQTGVYIAGFMYQKGNPGSRLLMAGRSSLNALRRQWTFFADKRPKHIDKSVAASPLGEIGYERFSIDDGMQCVHFGKLFEVMSGQRNHGLNGYICKDSADGFPHLDIQSILNTVGVLSVGEPDASSTPQPSKEPRWQAAEDTGCLIWNEQPNREEVATWNGSCERGKASGKGALVFRYLEDGVHKEARYEGTMVDGKPHGAGSWHIPDSFQYEGELTQGIPHGRGTMIAPNGRMYAGEYENGKKHGRGTCRSRRGRDTYACCFRDDKLSPCP